MREGVKAAKAPATATRNSFTKDTTSRSGSGGPTSITTATTTTATATVTAATGRVAAGNPPRRRIMEESDDDEMPAETLSREATNNDKSGEGKELAREAP